MSQFRTSRTWFGRGRRGWPTVTQSHESIARLVEQTMNLSAPDAPQRRPPARCRQTPQRGEQGSTTFSVNSISIVPPHLYASARTNRIRACAPASGS